MGIMTIRASSTVHGEGDKGFVSSLTELLKKRSCRLYWWGSESLARCVPLRYCYLLSAHSWEKFCSTSKSTNHSSDKLDNIIDDESSLHLYQIQHSNYFLMIHALSFGKTS